MSKSKSKRGGEYCTKADPEPSSSIKSSHICSFGVCCRGDRDSGKTVVLCDLGEGVESSDRGGGEEVALVLERWRGGMVAIGRHSRNDVERDAASDKGEGKGWRAKAKGWRRGALRA